MKNTKIFSKVCLVSHWTCQVWLKVRKCKNIIFKNSAKSLCLGMRGKIIEFSLITFHTRNIISSGIEKMIISLFSVVYGRYLNSLVDWHVKLIELKEDSAFIQLKSGDLIVNTVHSINKTYGVTPHHFLLQCRFSWLK